MWCCDSWFPPLPLCFPATAVFSSMAPVRLLSRFLEELLLQFLDLFLQSSTPLEILDESGDSGPHLSGGDYTFHKTRIGQRKKISVCFSAELFSGLTGFLSCAGFVKSPSEISIDYHGNCTGPVVAIVMPDGEELCMWLPQRTAHCMLNSDECTGSKVNRTEHKCRQGTTSPGIKPVKNNTNILWEIKAG